MRYLVWGLGVSGRSALRLLERKGYKVKAGDDAKGDRVEDFINETDIIVISPGIPPSHKIFELARKREIPIIGELELAFGFFEGKIIAITGTDGKSTTTRLIYNILKAYFDNVEEGGNTGRPFSDIVMKEEKGIAVLEVSSFQAKTIKRFKPDIAVFTNFSEDHLDWHPNLKDYLESKYKLFANQNKKDIAILNSNIKEVRNTPTIAKKIFFNSPEGAYFYKNCIYINNSKYIDATKIKLIGRHNIDNIMASILVCTSMGIPNEIIKENIYRFEGLPFRLSFVGEYKGIKIYNDSKATTINALASALKTFEDGEVILIAGGRLKSKNPDAVIPLIGKKLKVGIVYGESASLLSSIWKDDAEIIRADSLEEAVEIAFQQAKEGNVILFSPGCASFDMFSSYIERGEVFNKIVRRTILKGPSLS